MSFILSRSCSFVLGFLSSFILVIQFVNGSDQKINIKSSIHTITVVVILLAKNYKNK
tara:strand:+ start:312 stop:482 length:171 start_codon:yes stop_codon:yes gene_type:complete